MTWLLLAVWLLLMIFGIVFAVGPPWLTGLSQGGVEVESRGAKEVGDAYLRQGLHAPAIRQYLTALEIRPDYVGAQVNLAIAYGRSGQPSRGAKILRDALEQGTSRPGLVAYNLGDLLERLGNVEDAIDYYRKALNTTVRADRVWGKLGLAYQKIDRLEEAKTAFERALEARLDPRMTYQHMLRRAVHSQEEFPEALQVIKEKLAAGVRAEDLEPYDLGTIYQMQSGGRDVSMLRFHLGSVLARLGDPETAVGQLRKAIELWPRNTEAVELLKELQSIRSREEGSVPPQ
jgi:tetratricopeptide (TPR) repeat protein